MSNIYINVNQTDGYTKATNFVFSSQLDAITGIKFIRWNLGDGSYVYDVNKIEHNYKVAGQYNITVYGYTDTTFLSAQTAVNVDSFLKESIYFETVPPPTFAGFLNRYPFKVYITSGEEIEHYVNLYAQFSRSYPYQEPQNKWSFLKPQWRFLDLSGNQVWKVKTTDYPIKINSLGALSPTGITVGVSGYAEFYFVDDIYNHDLALEGKPYSTIWATLETSAIRVSIDSFNADLTLPNYSNSTAAAYMPYVVTRRNPDQLDITENGIDAHGNPRWTNADIPIVIKTGFIDYYADNWIDGNGIKEFDKEANFARYIPYDSANIPISAGVRNLSTSFTPFPEFLWKDLTNYQTAGYYKGSFTTNTPFAFNTNITAQANILTAPTSGAYFNPLIWLSNPQAGTVSVAQYYWNLSTYYSAISTPNMNVAQIKTFNMPILDKVDFKMDPMALSGFHGIYSIAALPAPTYHAWVCDSELDKLYRLNVTGQTLCSIDLNTVVKQNSLNYLVSGKLSPAQITLDGKQNLWVSLYDTLSVLKFNAAGEFLIAVYPPLRYTAPTNNTIRNLQWFFENSYFDSSVDGNYDYNLVEPTGIETNKFNQVWVSYSNSLSGLLVQYDENGNYLRSFFSPLCSTPQEMVSDKDGNIWICNAAINWNAPGSLEKRNSNGVLLSSIKGIRNPNYLTLDLNQNLWFSWGFNKIGTINNLTGNMQTYTVSGMDLKPTDYPKRNLPFDSKESINPWFDELQNADETAIEGIACDMRGYLYIINSIENQIYVFNTKTRIVEGRFYVNPQGFLFYQKDQLEPTIMAYYFWNKSLQAAGDWTGWKWTNKFGEEYLPYYKNTTTNYYISGTSPVLNFYDRSIYTAFKINEDFNLGSQMQTLAQMPILKDSPELFQNFLGSIFGKEPFYQDDLGMIAYEKIANFVGNHSDPDTCEIPQLYNLSQQIDYNSDDYLLNYPETIKRVMNLASVNLSKLLGTNCNCGSNYSPANDCAKREICPYCGREKAVNRGELLSLNYTVTAGIPLVLKTKSLNFYKKIPTGELNDQTTYTLNILTSSLQLPKDWTDFYEFYEYIDAYNGGIIENWIDWNSEQTTISRTLSTYEDWYKDEGILDLFFNYELYKGLDLLRDV